MEIILIGGILFIICAIVLWSLVFHESDDYRHQDDLEQIQYLDSLHNKE